MDVRLENETAWLSQAHMAKLFQTTVANVNIHLRNIFAEGELQADSVIKEFLTTAADDVSHQMAKELAEAEYEKFQLRRVAEDDATGSDFDRAVKQLPRQRKAKGTRNTE